MIQNIYWKNIPANIIILDFFFRGKENEKNFLFNSDPGLFEWQPINDPSKWFFRGISESSMARLTQQQAGKLVWDWFFP